MKCERRGENKMFISKRKEIVHVRTCYYQYAKLFLEYLLLNFWDFARWEALK